MIAVIFLLNVFAFQSVWSCSSAVHKRSVDYSDEHVKLKGSSFYKSLETGGHVNSIAGKVSFHSTPSRYHDLEGIAYASNGRHSYVYHPHPHVYHYYSPSPNTFLSRFLVNSNHYSAIHHQNYQSPFYYVPSVYSSSISMNSHNGRSIIAQSYNNNGQLRGSYSVSGYYPKK